jgi:hypothetical protein
MNTMLLIYSARTSARFEFIAGIIFDRILGVPYQITTSWSEYKNHSGPRFSYSVSSPPEGEFLEAHSLLWETKIAKQPVVVTPVDGLPVFFRGSHPGSLLPFDVFAASFYLISRYEEYLPYTGDRHGRFPATESLALCQNFLHLPLVNLWCRRFRDILANRFPELVFNPPPFRFIPTIDVDHTWCYLGRSWWKTAGGFLRSLLQLRFGEVSDRFLVLSGFRKDPFNTYEKIETWHQYRPDLPLFFFLHANYGDDDNNSGITSNNYKSLLSKLDRDGRIGIHPSMASGSGQRPLHLEIEALSSILGRKVTRSRQHFLKCKFPGTFRKLVREGIHEEYTLGYPTHPGFRASIAHPFPFFDLEENRSTELILHPVTFMDVTLRDQMRLNPQEALEAIHDYIQKVREVQGELVTIWHNESLSGYGRWQGWEHVYPAMVQRASSEI